MLVGITGPDGSGRHTALAHLVDQGLTEIPFTPDALEAVVTRWREPFVVLIPDVPGDVAKRPWFVHLHIEAPDDVRERRIVARDGPGNGSGGGLRAQTAAEFAARLENARVAHITLVNAFATRTELGAALDALKVLDGERVRPSWDRYFMTIAELAAQRSNCMKRRVGCVLERERRIVSTGYNGTPRGFKNCNDGGCPRCNAASRGGTLLSTCLCLHAEENALLEAGRDRVAGGTLYCNTCPCLTCSIKVVQSGVREVVYSQDYSMDQESARVLQAGGVALRQYKVPLSNA